MYLFGFENTMHMCLCVCVQSKMHCKRCLVVSFFVSAAAAVCQQSVCIQQVIAVSATCDSVCVEYMFGTVAAKVLLVNISFSLSVDPSMLLLHMHVDAYMCTHECLTIALCRYMYKYPKECYYCRS